MATDTAVRTGNVRSLAVFLTAGMVLAVAPVELLRWPGTPIVVGPLLGLGAAFVALAPARWAPAYVAATGAGALAIGAVVWDGLWPGAVVATVAAAVEVALVGLGAHRWPGALRFERRTGVLELVAIAAVTVVGVELAAAAVLAAVDGTAAPHPWYLAAAADLTSIAVLVPAIVMAPTVRRVERRTQVALAAGVVVVVLTSLAAFQTSFLAEYVRPFAVLTIVVFLCGWLGPPGATVLPLVAVAMATALTARGTGAFWETSTDVSSAAQLLAIYSMSVVVVGWLVAATTAERAAASTERDDELVRHREARAHLEAERQRMMLAKGMASLGSWELDLAAGTTEWSEGMCRLAGLEPADIVFTLEEANQRLHPDDRPVMQAYVSAMVEGGHPSPVESRIVRPDGQVRWLQSAMTAVGPDRWVGFSQDITERRQREQALREHDERLRLTQEHAPIGMATVDLDGRWIEVNNALCTMLGRSRDELEGVAFDEITLPDDLPADHELKRQLIAGELDAGALEKRYLRPDGTTIWVLLNVSLLRTDDGSPRFFIAQVVDITERRRDEERLRRSADELRKASEAKTQFLSRMSHELRTPLNAVLGFAQLLQLSVRGDERDAVDEILHAGRHLLDLIDEVLDITAAETGVLSVELEPVPLASAIHDAVRLTRPLAAGRQVEITVTGDATGEVVASADRRHTMQILLHLLANAVTFNHRGGRVSVTARRAGDRATVAVSDTGIGIPADALDEIFQPFARLDADARGVEGSGIGLSLARSLAEGMHGTIAVSSEVGAGSTFVLTLPAHVHVPDEAARPLTDRAVRVEAPHRATAR